MVVGEAAVVEHHLLGRGVDLFHLPQQDLDVGGFAQQPAQGRGHVGLRHQAGGHLIEQGLEEVEVALVDQGHAHRLAPQGLGRLESGETAAHDHHVGQLGAGAPRWIEFEEEPFRRHGWVAGAHKV